MSFLRKHWPLLAVGGAAVAGIVLYEKYAHKTPKLPISTQVALQPGSTAVAIAKNGSVLLTLPTGTTWATTKPLSPLNPTATPPMGSQAFNVTMGAQVGTFPLVAAWTDSSGKTQTTNIAISVA